MVTDRSVCSRDGCGAAVSDRGGTALRWTILGLGAALACVAFVLRSHAAIDATSQVWPAFALVAGLLLVGFVANGDGIFLYAGRWLARASPSRLVLYLGCTCLVGVVTAVLNLDTSVVFLTPVLVHTARARGEREGRLLIASLLLANAASLLLPGSNLTNLIVFGHARASGGAFLTEMWVPELVAVVVTAGLVWFFEPAVRDAPAGRDGPEGATFGLGLCAIVASAVLVVALRAPALPVLAVGVAAICLRLATRRVRPGVVLDAVGVPMLAGLLGIAVALGTLGRSWAWPTTALAHVGPWGAAGAGAVAAVLFNNLPAAALLSAHRPAQPYALLVGLNLGPNLFASGSLAWYLWWKVAKTAGANPSILRASRVGLLAAPLSVVAATAVLVLQGTR